MSVLLPVLIIALLCGLIGAMPLSFMVPWFVARSRFGALARALGSEASWGVSFQAAPGGVPLTATIEMPKGAWRPRLVLRLPRRRTDQVVPAITLRAATFLDRLGLALGINRTVDLGHPGVYIETDEPDECVRAALGDVHARRAAELVTAAGAEVVWGDDGLTATIQNPKKRHFAPELLTTLGPALGALAVAAESTAGVAPRRASGRAVLVGAGFVLIGVVATCACIAAASTFMPVDRLAYGAGIALALPAIAVATPFLARKVRGKSDSFRTLLSMVVPLGLWILPCLFIAGFLASNGLLDGSRPIRYQRIVRESYWTTGKNPHSVVVFDGIRPGSTLRFDLGSSGRALPARGERVALVVGAGFFGFPWIVEGSFL